MGKDIDLTGMAGVTGQPDGFSVPPPAATPPGVTSGQPPLSVGEAVIALNPKDLTDAERRTLKAIGWKEGAPIPSNMANIVERVSAEAKQTVMGSLPPPVDPATPPVTLNTVDVENMTPEQRAHYEREISLALGQAAQQSGEQAMKMSDAAKQIIAARQLPGAAAEVPVRPATSAVPNIAQVPAAAVPPPFAPMTAPPAAAAPPPPPPPVAAVPLPPPQPPPPPPVATATIPPPPVAEPAVEPESIIDASSGSCPHCGWDMSAIDIPEPSDVEKMTYVQAMLGLKPFARDYDLLGGQMTVGFRTLTTQEIDEIYAQVYRERERGDIPTEIDFWERVNRYRLFLQLSSIRGPAMAGQYVTYPEGLSVESNPNAGSYWKVDEGAEALPAIGAYILKTALVSESMTRTIQGVCSQFNRLVSKMEGMTENPDFWPTAGVSA